MKVLAGAILGVLVACGAWAGQLKTTGNAPTMEATVTGADTCAAGTVTIPSPVVLTIRRRWIGVTNGQDSLTSVVPGAAFVMTAGVPTGTYVVTVDSHGGGSDWSCGAVITTLVHGKPAKITNLGDAMLFPRRLPELLAQRLRA